MTAQLTVLLKPELLAELKRAAEVEEVSVSHVVRRVLRERFKPRAADRLADEHQRHV